MKETEVKILEINPKDVKKRLERLGAKNIFEGEVVWTAFDFADKSFSQQEILIRLRKKGKEAELTLKRLLSRTKVKTSDELNIVVGDYEAAKNFLLAIGLKEKFGYPLHKHRISYLLDDVRFEIDTFSEFPTYLEIEAKNAETINEYVGKLGFSTNDIKPWGTREVFNHYRKYAQS
ncbi:MAG: class IV adenylate cyclase [Candidatus Doudnabacteria bacterium]|nr:class IV adenylate cyclase [Candidatus Doudnabacteria bacterium]